MPCLFGWFDFPDDLQHYVRCPVLWRVISYCVRLPLFGSVLGIFTITKQSFYDALRLVVACNAYHTFEQSSSLNIVSLLSQGASLAIEKFSARLCARTLFLFCIGQIWARVRRDIF